MQRILAFYFGGLKTFPGATNPGKVRAKGSQEGTFGDTALKVPFISPKQNDRDVVALSQMVA